MNKSIVYRFVDSTDWADRVDAFTLFAEIMGNDRAKGIAFRRFLFDTFANDNTTRRQRKRFLEMLYVVEEPKFWREFLLHEKDREKSVWNDECVKEFADRLTNWYEADDTSVDRAIKQKLSSFVDLATLWLNRQDFLKWRLMVLRQAFVKAMEGQEP